MKTRPRKDSTVPRAAQAHLDEWSEPDKAWVRIYYPSGTDEPHDDITPPVETILLWLEDHWGRQFVGTESRLNTLFELGAASHQPAPSRALNPVGVKR